MLVLRGVLGPLLDRGADARTAEVDAAFARDVAERGAEEASAPMGAGGEAAMRRETAPCSSPGPLPAAVSSV